jgi:cell division initiation protein
MAQVDEFLDALTADYTALYKENAVLKSKMKVLVDKIEEYRSTEDAMRMTLLSAQKMANAMVAEAEEKKAAFLKEAEANATSQIDEIRREVEKEEFRLTAAKNATAAYLYKLKELYEHERDYLSNLSELVPPAPKPPDPVETAAAQIEDTVSRLVSQEAPTEGVETPEDDPEDTKELGPGIPVGAAVSASPAETEEAPKSSVFQIIDLTLGGGGEKQSDRESPADARRIDFSNLQFGKDYEIK